MNYEMMLYQARQDFIDMHKELLQGNTLSLDKYDSIAKDLKKLDDINFELMLQFVEKTDGIEIRPIWSEISAYIEAVKKKGEWPTRKEEKLSWKEGQLTIEGV